MPAEGIHFSALTDSLPKVKHPAAAKLGAVFVDLPYFARFSLAVVRYLVSAPPLSSPWGEVTHTRAPIAVGRGLIEAAARLGGDDGAWLHDFALGYICHAAVDRSVHPFVNQLAAQRASRLDDSPARQHLEVEKFQSIIFHDARMGFEVMGTRALYEHCIVDPRPVTEGRTAETVHRVLVAAWGEAPPVRELASWARGYVQYVGLISSPLGRTVAPRAQKESERAELFTGFLPRFDAAVQQSRTWLQALAGYAADGRFDASAKAQLEAVIPEGTIDPL